MEQQYRKQYNTEYTKWKKINEIKTKQKEYYKT